MNKTNLAFFGILFAWSSNLFCPKQTGPKTVRFALPLAERNPNIPARIKYNSTPEGRRKAIEYLERIPEVHESGCFKPEELTKIDWADLKEEIKKLLAWLNTESRSQHEVIAAIKKILSRHHAHISCVVLSILTALEERLTILEYQASLVQRLTDHLGASDFTNKSDKALKLINNFINKLSTIERMVHEENADAIGLTTFECASLFAEAIKAIKIASRILEPMRLDEDPLLFSAFNVIIGETRTLMNLLFAIEVCCHQ